MVEGRVNSSPVKPRKKYPDYRKYQECKYCPSCFECPLEDCKLSLTVVAFRNALPEDRHRNRRMGQLADFDTAKDAAVSAEWLKRWKSIYG